MKTSKFESSLEKFGLKLEKYIAPPLVKLGNQRHFAAIRAALIRTIPLIIVGSLPLILTNLPIEFLANMMKPYADSLNVLFNMSFGFISLFLAISLGAEMAKMYDELEVTTVSIVTVACYLIVVSPINLVEGVIAVEGLSAKGMFAAFIVSVIVTEFMHFALKHNIAIRMPKRVPENISKSFGALVPMAILLCVFWFTRIILNFDLYALINSLISPLLVVADTWYAALICAFLLQALWFVGIHGGSFTVWGVMYPFLLSNIAENATAAAAGKPIPHILTEPFFYTYAMIGGVGLTLPLVFIWWKSKSVTLREVAHISAIPGIFCINEPVMFGAPIVLNPIMLIPFIFGTTVVGTLYGYIITTLGWVSPAIIQIPWTTPPLLQPYLATGGDWRAVIAQLILIIFAFIMWYPFAKMWERRCIEEERETEITESKK